MDYTLERLSSYQYSQPDMNMQGLIGFISQVFILLRAIPRRFKANFEIRLYRTIYDALKNEIMKKRCVDEFLFSSQDPFSQ